MEKSEAARFLRYLISLRNKSHNYIKKSFQIKYYIKVHTTFQSFLTITFHWACVCFLLHHYCWYQELYFFQLHCTRIDFCLSEILFLDFGELIRSCKYVAVFAMGHIKHNQSTNSNYLVVKCNLIVKVY